MNSDKKNIDQLFNQALRQYREKPPLGAWKRLAQDLDSEKQGKHWIYWRLIAASVLILIAFGAGYFYATFNKPEPQFVIDAKPPELNKENKIHENSVYDKVKDEPMNNNLVQEKEAKIRNLTKPAFSSDDSELKDNNYAGNKLNSKLSETKEIVTLQIQKADSPATQEFPDVFAKQDKPTIVPDQPNMKDIESEELAVVNKSDNSYPYNPNEDLLFDESMKRQRTRWSVGAQFAPVYSYRDISINYENQSQNNPNEIESQYDQSEDALMTYAGGIDVNYSFNNRWNLQSGVYYSKIGQVNNDALNFVQDNDQYLLFAINTSTGNINVAFEKIPDNIRKINPPKDTLESIDLNNVKIVQNFNLLEIPFIVKYNLMNRKLGISVSGGICPAYVVKNRTYLQVDREKYDIGNSGNLNTMIYSSTVGIGFNYAISKALQLNFEPVFKYALSPINKNSQFDYHPYSLSWFTGLSYKF